MSNRLLINAIDFLQKLIPKYICYNYDRYLIFSVIRIYNLFVLAALFLRRTKAKIYISIFAIFTHCLGRKNKKKKRAAES